MFDSPVKTNSTEFMVHWDISQKLLSIHITQAILNHWYFPRLSNLNWHIEQVRTKSSGINVERKIIVIIRLGDDKSYRFVFNKIIKPQLIALKKVSNVAAWKPDRKSLEMCQINTMEKSSFLCYFVGWLGFLVCGYLI